MNENTQTTLDAQEFLTSISATIKNLTGKCKSWMASKEWSKSVTVQREKLIGSFFDYMITQDSKFESRDKQSLTLQLSENLIQSYNDLSVQWKDLSSTDKNMMHVKCLTEALGSTVCQTKSKNDDGSRHSLLFRFYLLRQAVVACESMEATNMVFEDYVICALRILFLTWQAQAQWDGQEMQIMKLMASRVVNLCNMIKLAPVPFFFSNRFYGRVIKSFVPKRAMSFVQLLSCSGACGHAFDRKSNNALHILARDNLAGTISKDVFKNFVTLLLELGACPHHKNSKGLIAADLARNQICRNILLHARSSENLASKTSSVTTGVVGKHHAPFEGFVSKIHERIIKNH